MSTVETFEFEGCKFGYRIFGSGPPLVNIQGVGVYGISPDPLTEILKDRFTILSFDNRGVGRSQPAAMKLTVPQMTRDTLALLDHVGWESAHIMGHSLGGLIALDLALNAKHRAQPVAAVHLRAWCRWHSGLG